MHHIGDLLKRARENRALSQVEVANRIGARQSHISRWEKMSAISTDTFQKVLEALGYQLRIAPASQSAVPAVAPVTTTELARVAEEETEAPSAEEEEQEEEVVDLEDAPEDDEQESDQDE